MTTTALDAYRALARALDDLGGPYTATAAAASSVTVPLLVDNTAGASTNGHAGSWVYVAAGVGLGQQRRVVSNGFVPATGTVTVEAPWTTEPAASTIDLTHLFPAVPPPGNDTGYLDLLREASMHVLVERTVTLTTVANQPDYSLSALAGWLRSADQILEVLDPPRVAGDINRTSWRRWQVSFVGTTPTLEFIDRPYPTSGATFELVVVSPAGTLVNGAESASGITAMSDTTMLPVQDWVDVALLEAYRTLMAGRAPGRPTGPWRQAWQAQKGIVKRVRGYDGAFDQEPEQQQAPAQRAVA